MIKLEKRYPFLVIVFLPIVMHIPIWLGVVDFYSGDGSDLIPYFYGTKSLLYQTFQKNIEIPLWNPHIMFGQPIIGNIQYCLFYPLNYIFLIVPFFKALPFYQMAHLIIAGLGTYFLCRYTGCKKGGSTLAACLMILNGRSIYYINAGWFTYFSSICWIPFFLLFSLKVIEKKELYYPVILGVIFAMTLLSGTPQYAFLCFYLFLLYGIYYLFHTQSRDDRLQLLFRISLTALLSFLLIGVQLFPAMEQTYLSTRPLREGDVLGFHFQWALKQWIRILFRPEFLLHDFAWELCAYIGIGGILLSFLGLISSKKQFGLICIWGIIPWLLSMGTAIPILSSITGQIPGISMLTNPSRYFIFTILVLSLLSGHGFDYIIDSKKYRNRHFFIIAVICLGLISIGIVIRPYSQITESADIRYFIAIIVFFIFATLYLWRGTKIFLALFICWIIMDPAYIAMEILLKEKYYIKDLQPPQKIINALNKSAKTPRIASIQSEDLWYANLLTPFADWICIDKGIDRASGYEPLGMFKTHRFASQMDGTGSIKTLWGFRLWSFANPRLFDVGGITHLITSEPLDSPRLELITEDIITMPNFHGGWWKEKSLYLYENVHVMPRAFLILNNRENNILPIKFRANSPNQRQLIFRTEYAGTVVISESFHPGWVASEKKDKFHLKPFLDTFISFNVKAGEYDIILDFKPKSLRIGSMFTVTGLILIILCFLYQKSWPFKKSIE